jgi:hypothetical protein
MEEIRHAKSPKRSKKKKGEKAAYEQLVLFQPAPEVANDVFVVAFLENRNFHHEVVQDFILFRCDDFHCVVFSILHMATLSTAKEREQGREKKR